MKQLIPLPEFLYNNRSNVSQNIKLHHSFFSIGIFIKISMEKNQLSNKIKIENK